MAKHGHVVFGKQKRIPLVTETHEKTKVSNALRVFNVKYPQSSHLFRHLVDTH